jgi:hypothetical protein
MNNEKRNEENWRNSRTKSREYVNKEVNEEDMCGKRK